ncbi:MAG: FAD-dependent monooxygenase [Parasphingorhabdus sp.]|nr:FAD-dependent monooxygenase [Parasphingorhabdus sp.]
MLIIGGGIGGLTSALCLAHFGIKSTIFERAAGLEEVGAGIQLSPNAMRVMQRLGLEDAIIAAGCLPRAAQIRDGINGTVLATNRLGDTALSRYGAPYVHIHRADLVGILATALDQRQPGALRLQHRISAIRQNSERVELDIGKNSIAGDLLIGADGMHSIVRATWATSEPPRYSGHTAWRFTAPTTALGRDAPLPAATVWVGDHQHAVTYNVRGGALTNFVGVVEAPLAGQEDWSATGSRAELRAAFGGWHRTISRMIDTADSFNRWPLFDRPPLAHFHDHHIVLVGDAAHPMLPFLAQGAAQAIEDSYVLAQQLASTPDISTALAAYSAQRVERTVRVQRASVALADIYHRRPTALAVAAKPLATRIMGKQFDWLYGHDVTTPD